MPVIEAKLARPRPRAGVIRRERLFAVLDRLESTELTVVSGPAGSGKTVLVSSWLTFRPGLASAWVTLDSRDDDAARFWGYVAHAVDRLRPGIAQPALAVLRTPRPGVESAVEELLNGLAGYDGRVVIVLDDLHRVSAEATLRSLTHAVERLPESTRMIVTTRSDPGRRLSRLRARGGLGELRAKDIAFTSDEAHELLVHHAGLPVSEEDVALLVDRTEGWPAGMSLASLWLAGIEEPAEGIREFSATNRHVADYLGAEVLDVVDEETRDFLLKASIFDRFAARACDAVLGITGSRRQLANLERSNLFLVGLDGRGDWYRFHHLFRELLRLELLNRAPEVAPELHRRAAEWFQTEGLIEEALQHAHAVGPDALGAMLAEEHLNLIRAGKVDVLSHFLGLLSDEEIGQHPVAAAAGVIAAGDSDRQIARRRQLAAIAEANLDKVPEAQQRYVEFVVALGRSSFVDDELDVITRHATRAVELAQEHVHGLVVIALAVLAYGQYLRGDSAAARAGVEEAMAVPDAPRQLHGFIYARALQALLASDEGRPKLAEASARETVSMTRDLGLAATWSAGLAHHALGQALLQLGRAQEAERELERAEILRRAPEPRLDHVHSLLVLSQARIARGRLMLAATELESARERLGVFVERGRLEPLLRDVERQLDEAHAGSPRQIEPPTPAELAVLRLLATDLSQREIGSELFLSMNTVKTHARNIYGKLGVSSRKDAVRSANALGLI